MKDLGETKAIIGQEITRDIKEETLKIDQKRYIQDFFESKSIGSCHLKIFLVKAGLTLIFDQVDDHISVNLIVYQQLVSKLMYLAYGIRPEIAFVVR